MTTDKMEPRLAARVEESKRRGAAMATVEPAAEDLRHPVTSYTMWLVRSKPRSPTWTIARRS